jgi:hypothetical protein
LAYTYGSILAGPIVRRVERSLASVWVALREPANVVLRVFDGIREGDTTDTPLAMGERDTLTVGKWLHIAVVTIRFEESSPLFSDRIYGYDLGLRPVGSQDTPTGLKALGLLNEGEVEGRKRLPLGYTVGRLPAFMLPPSDIGRLKLLTGSCRKPHNSDPDAMPALDDLLSKGEAYLDPAKRPHQMFLTGDQIYADEVPIDLLNVLTPIGAGLLSGDGAVAERLPFSHTVGNQEVWELPVTTAHFPPARRQRLLRRQAGFTSGSGGSHVLGFGEYAALYLMGWSNQLWPVEWDKDALADRAARATAFKIAWGKLKPAYDAAVGLDDDQKETIEAKIEYARAAPMLRPEWRRIDKHLDDAARRADWGEEDVGGFPIGAPPDTVTDVAAGPPPVPDPEVGRALARALTPSWFAARREMGFRFDGEDLTQDRALSEIRAVQEFQKGLPKVRRLLANVPTYMTFDDHEVTDDWNLSGAWVADVNLRPMGRAVLRNALLSFGLFQAWGNDPLYFDPPKGEPDTPGKAMLDRARRMFFDAKGDPLTSAPAEAPAAALDRLFNIGQSQDRPFAERVRWHWRVGGPGYEVLSLDTRTMRGFPTPDGPPELLTRAALEAQIPAVPVYSYGSPGEGAGVTFVIAAAPVLGFPPVEYIVQPVVNTRDRMSSAPTGPLAEAEKDYHTGFFDHDPEPWTYQEHVFEGLLERLAPYRRIVFISGDVHYSCCLKLDYWRYDPAQPAADPVHTSFVQVTSSGFRNQTTRAKVNLFQSGFISQLTQVLGVPRERIGYRTEGRQPPLVPPEGVPFSRALEAQNHAPLALFPVAAIPDGTHQLYRPSFAWRLKLERDGRGDADRLDKVEGVPTLPEGEVTGGSLTNATSARHFWETQHVPSRLVTFLNNGGELGVSTEAGLPVELRYTVHHTLRGFAGNRFGPFTAYAVALDDEGRAPAELPDVPVG